MDAKSAVYDSAKELGYDRLKDKAIMSFLGGKDTFVVLPTGYGKSVIFSVLPGAFDKYLGEYQSVAVACISSL